MRSLLETTPSVIVRARPKGVPMAITSWPAMSLLLSPSSACLNSILFCLTCVHVHLHDGQVGPVIVADQLGGDAFLVEQRDVDLGGAAGDVKVGEDAAVVVDDDARADCRGEPCVCLRNKSSCATSSRTTEGKIRAVTSTTACGVALGNGSGPGSVLRVAPSAPRAEGSASDARSANAREDGGLK